MLLLFLFQFCFVFLGGLQLFVQASKFHPYYGMRIDYSCFNLKDHTRSSMTLSFSTKSWKLSHLKIKSKFWDKCRSTRLKTNTQTLLRLTNFLTFLRKIPMSSPWDTSWLQSILQTATLIVYNITMTRGHSILQSGGTRNFGLF